MNGTRNTGGRLQSFAALAAAAAAIWAAVEARTVSRNVELCEARSEALATTNTDELRADMNARFDQLRIELDHQLQVVNAFFTEVEDRLDSQAELLLDLVNSD